MSAAVERLLAELYTDPVARARFLADRAAFLAERDLDSEAYEAFLGMDGEGLELAGESFGRKRALKVRPWWRRRA